MEVGKVKTKRVIKIIGIYQLVLALICIFSVIVLVFTKDIGSLSTWISVIIPSVLAIVTVMNSIDIWISKDFGSLRQGSIVNGIIFSLQIVTLAVDGFIYQYTQGARFALLINIEHLTESVRWGMLFDPMIFIFDMRFDPSDTVIGVNLLALLLAVISFWAAGILKDNVAEPN